MTQLAYYTEANNAYKEQLNYLEEELEHRDVFNFFNETFLKEGEFAGSTNNLELGTDKNSDTAFEFINYGIDVESKRLMGQHLYDIGLIEAVEEEEKKKDKGFDPRNSVFKQKLDNYGVVEDDSSKEKRYDVIKDAI